MDKIQLLTKSYTKQNVPSLRSGDTVRVYERIKEGDKERLQIFEGLVIYTKHGTKNPNSTFTIRKISVHGVGVEKTFPLHSPSIQKIEVVKHDKVRRAKLYYIRDLIGKKKKKAAAKMLGMVYEEERVEEPAEAEVAEETTEEAAAEQTEAREVEVKIEEKHATEATTPEENIVEIAEEKEPTEQSEETQSKKSV